MNMLTTKISCYKKQDSAFENATLKNHQFYFAFDVYKGGCKNYGSTLSLQEFFDAYMDDVERDDIACNYYELMKTEIPRFETYDIDLEFEKVEEKYHIDMTPEQVFKWFCKLRELYVESTGRAYAYKQLLATDYRVLDSSNEKKISLHIINRGHVWKNHSEMKMWYDDLKEFCILYKQQGYHKTCLGTPDFSIASENRCMRIIYSSKFNQNRPLLPAKWHKESVNSSPHEFFSSIPTGCWNEETCRKFDEKTSILETKISDIKANREFISKEAQKAQIDDPIETSSSKLEILINLIYAQIKTGTHSLCDKLGPDNTLLVYRDFLSLSFAFFHGMKECNIEEDKGLKIWEDKIFPLYRHNSNIQSEQQWRRILLASTKSDKIYTIKSLYFWARENKEYSTYFKPAKVESLPFNKDEDYFFSDFKKEIQNRIWDKQELLNYFIINFPRVCHIMSGAVDEYLIKRTSDILYENSKKINFTGGIAYHQIISDAYEKLKTKVTRDDFDDIYYLVRKHLPYYTAYNFTPYDIYKPKKDTSKILNLYGGFKAKLLSDEIYTALPKNDYGAPIGTECFLNHIKEVWASNNEEYFAFFLNWLTWITCRPDKVSQVVPVLYGEQGCGKGILVEWLMNYYFGLPISTKVAGLEKITHRFNGLLMNKVFTIIDEGTDGDSHKNKGQAFDTFKTYISDTDQTVEQKGKECIQVKNYNNYIYLTNHHNSFNVQSGDRRTAVFNCSSKYCKNFSYFTKLSQGLENPDLNDMLYTFFYKRGQELLIPPHTCIPRTEIKESMALLSADMPTKFLTMIASGDYKINFDNGSSRMISDRSNYYFRSQNEKINKFYEIAENQKYINSIDLFDAFRMWSINQNEKDIYTQIKFTCIIKTKLKYSRIRTGTKDAVQVFDLTTNPYLENTTQSDDDNNEDEISNITSDNE